MDILTEPRKKLLLIEDYYGWKTLLADYKGFYPFNLIEMTLVMTKKDFYNKNIKNKYFDFCVIDWHMGDHTGDWYVDKVNAGGKYMITAIKPLPDELIMYCNKTGIALYRKPIGPAHIKRVLGMKLTKKEIRCLYHEEVA